jgi:hypothetical protein
LGAASLIGGMLANLHDIWCETLHNMGRKFRKLGKDGVPNPSASIPFDLEIPPGA